MWVCSISSIHGVVFMHCFSLLFANTFYTDSQYHITEDMKEVETTLCFTLSITTNHAVLKLNCG